MDRVDDVWNLAIKGSKKFDSDADAQIFNAYFTEYCELAAGIWKRIPFAIEHTWTPKRRRKVLSVDAESRGELTPRSFEGTPVKLRSP